MTNDSLFEALHSHYEKGLPFVVYSKPEDQTLKGFLQENDSLYTTEDFVESGFVFAPFNLEQQSVLFPLEHSKYLKSIIPLETGIQRKSKAMSEEISAFPGTVKKDAHIQLVEKGIEAIKDNHLKKVVLSRCEEVTIQNTSPIEFFQKLLKSYLKAFVYCWFHPKIGLWLGATPEALLRLHGNRLETTSLAGTQAFSGTTDVDWKQKELQEQQIVTDFIVANLKPSINNLKVSDTKTVKAGNLLHLKTSISGSLNNSDSDFKALLHNLHPTPAVCGLPKNNAKHFILENEDYNREFYTGFLGELNLKETKTRNANRRNVENNAYTSVKTVSNLFVNLRCMQLKDEKALIYVGGGITKDSNPEAEWEETTKKTQTMRSVL